MGLGQLEIFVWDGGHLRVGSEFRVTGLVEVSTYSPGRLSGRSGSQGAVQPFFLGCVLVCGQRPAVWRVDLRSGPSLSL